MIGIWREEAKPLDLEKNRWLLLQHATPVVACVVKTRYGLVCNRNLNTARAVVHPFPTSGFARSRPQIKTPSRIGRTESHRFAISGL